MGAALERRVHGGKEHWAWGTGNSGLRPGIATQWCGLVLNPWSLDVLVCKMGTTLTSIRAGCCEGKICWAGGLLTSSRVTSRWCWPAICHHSFYQHSSMVLLKPINQTTGDVPLVSKVGCIVLLWPHSIGNCSLSTWAGTEEFGEDLRKWGFAPELCCQHRSIL